MMFLRALLFSFLTLCIPFSFAVPSDVESDFKRLFDNTMRKYNVPGGAYTIVKNGKVLALETYGVRGHKDKRPVDERTKFRLASVSKTFSADLAAILVNQGMFSWNDPLVKYLPKFKLKKQGQAEALTVLHLLSHSSGLMPNAFDGYLKGHYRFSNIVKKFSTLEAYCQPGNCYGYQNIMFSFIEPIIEQSTGKSFAEQMHLQIFAPLGMEQASIGYSAFKSADNKALPHVKASRKGPWHQVRVKDDFYHVAAAAGVNASITDMSKWLKAQLGHTPNVLSQDVLAMIRTPVVRTKKELKRRKWRDLLDDAHYGLGWRIYESDGQQLYFHGGWVEGFRSVIAYSVEHDMGVVILMNAESRAMNDMASSFWQLLLKQPSQVI